MFSPSLFSFLFSLFSSLFFSPSDHDYCASVSYCSDTSVNKPVNKKKEPSSSKSSNHACSHPVCCCPSDFGCRCKTEKCKSDYCSAKSPSPAKNDEGYMKEEGDKMCNSVSNRELLPDKAACEAAATSMGLDDVVADDVQSGMRGSYPPGCFQSNNGRLVFNTMSTSTASCTSNSDFCLCITSPADEGLGAGWWLLIILVSLLFCGAILEVLESSNFDVYV